MARIAGRTGGQYSARHHAIEEPGVSEALLTANIGRLEAMRRAGLVERRSDGVFEIGEDHLERAHAFEKRLARSSPMTLRVASYWTLAEQVDALGPTHLDHVLAGQASSPVGGGAYPRRHAAALQQRRLFLIEQGAMGRDDQSLPGASLARMADLELRTLARRLSKELGVVVSTAQVASVRGVYARRIDLAQGRVALILGDRSAHLAPWRPALERFAGREVAGVLKGRTLSWGLARAGPSLPPM